VRPIATAADEIVPPLLAILAMLGATAWCVFRRPTWGFLGGWFFVILAPTSSIAPIVNLEFEHRMYLSLAAVAVAVVVAAHKALLWLASRSSVFRIARHRLAAMVLTIAVAILGCTTYARNEAYCSEMAIWQDVIEHSPLPNYHAFHAVGRGLSAHGDQSAAIACYRQALRIFEDQVVWNDLGRAYMRLGERDKACGCYERALEIAPKLVSANVNLAILLRDEAPHEAIRHCRMAIETAPDNAEAHDALASLLQQQKQFDEAMDHYRLAVTCDPEFAAPHSNLGGLLARLGRFDEAVAEFETTLVMDPDFPTAQCNLDLARRLLATQRNARGAETGPASAAGSPSRR
jgi:tetratricopeptide (TPR) repeat protein